MTLYVIFKEAVQYEYKQSTQTPILYSCIKTGNHTCIHKTEKSVSCIWLHDIHCMCEAND